MTGSEFQEIWRAIHGLNERLDKFEEQLEFVKLALTSPAASKEAILAEMQAAAYRERGDS